MSLKHLPIFLFLLIYLTLAVTFSIALHFKHITYILPYISDSGTYPPESCIFGLMLNFMAALICITMYVRYLQVREIIKKHNFPHQIQKINKISLFIGINACVGCSIVANFQETTMLSVHWIGAIMLFVSGAIYQGFQTVIYFKILPVFGNRRLNLIRTVIACASNASVVVFVTSGLIAGGQFKGDDVTKWKKEDGGFEFHLVSTISEWICANCTMIYLLLFVWDFKSIDLSEPEISVQDNFAVIIKTS
ncbi:DNA damage-regulated autophagy modulator protein 2-like Protein [Tribolium castaneum]|uniref:DNA damage-regulated autophagy modulator protein 2-like Protein n=2 Tax=Tribolium castaneum TaxID=7070 RepID=A0A139WMI7_TRICA|nr:DNA damage-regulated autophagy modulator protein 2-like Protein [Tribolium castaneum]